MFLCNGYDSSTLLDSYFQNFPLTPFPVYHLIQIQSSFLPKLRRILPNLLLIPPLPLEFLGRCPVVLDLPIPLPVVGGCSSSHTPLGL